MNETPKNGVWMVVFITEVNFSILENNKTVLCPAKYVDENRPNVGKS